MRKVIENMPRLWENIKEDWKSNGKDWTKPGFRSLAVCRFGQWRMGIRNKIFRAPFSILYKLMFRHCRNVYGIELPYTVKLGRGIIIEHQGGIVIHGQAEIGDNCIIRHGVTLGNRYMDRPHEAPKLGANVNIGAGVKILGDIHIADNVSIGANSVVINNFETDSTIAGVPAKKVSNAFVC